VLDMACYVFLSSSNFQAICVSSGYGIHEIPTVV